MWNINGLLKNSACTNFNTNTALTEAPNSTRNRLPKFIIFAPLLRVAAAVARNELI
jgi:hypothetical protein